MRSYGFTPHHPLPGTAVSTPPLCGLKYVCVCGNCENLTKIVRVSVAGKGLQEKTNRRRDCTCTHVCVSGGPIWTEAWDLLSVSHFSVFQQWQAKEWKLALTSNYILPACQGLWDYRLTGLQSALPFCTLILSFPCLPCVRAYLCFQTSPIQWFNYLFLILLSPGK